MAPPLFRLLSCFRRIRLDSSPLVFLCGDPALVVLVTCVDRYEHSLLQDVPSIIKNCKAPGPLYLSVLRENELRHLNNMMGRLYQLAEAATAVSASSTLLHCHLEGPLVNVVFCVCGSAGSCLTEVLFGEG